MDTLLDQQQIRQFTNMFKQLSATSPDPVYVGGKYYYFNK
jgi:hypothetical protein